MDHIYFFLEHFGGSILVLLGTNYIYNMKTRVKSSYFSLRWFFHLLPLLFHPSPWHKLFSALFFFFADLFFTFIYGHFKIVSKKHEQDDFLTDFSCFKRFSPSKMLTLVMPMLIMKSSRLQSTSSYIIEYWLSASSRYL